MIPTKNLYTTPFSERLTTVFKKNIYVAEPFIIVSDGQNGSKKIIEINTYPNYGIQDMLIVGRELMEQYSLFDIFVFETHSKLWYNIKKGSLGYTISTMFIS